MKVYAATLLYHEIEFKWNFLKLIHNITKHSLCLNVLFFWGNCTLLRYYAANSGNFLPTFWDSPESIGLLNAEDGTDRLSQNVSKKYVQIQFGGTFY